MMTKYTSILLISTQTLVFCLCCINAVSCDRKKKNLVSFMYYLFIYLFNAVIESMIRPISIILLYTMKNTPSVIFSSRPVGSQWAKE